MTATYSTASLCLAGCTPEPLANYLKALGVLRVVSEQYDRSARGCWQGDRFWLETHYSRDEIVDFFLSGQGYCPTPFVSPWNSSTGFYPQSAKKDDKYSTTIGKIIASQAPRLEIYREAIAIAQATIRDLQLKSSPSGADKSRLIEQLRNRWPNEALPWLDASIFLTESGAEFPPLAGTGGNDGNFEFGRGVIWQLERLLDFATGEAQPKAQVLLEASLFGAVQPGLPWSGAIGQFNPIAAGGDNAGPGFGADSRANPWDWLLLMEGLVLFAAGATRRYERSEQATLAYPFMVRPSHAGYSSASRQDKVRAELWAPLWPQPASLAEVRVLFAEGRAKLKRRTVRDGVDFYCALGSLGVSRGLSEFARFSFQERNGRAYFAVALDRVARPQAARPELDSLIEIRDWRDKLKRLAADEKTPGAIASAHRQLEEAIVRLATGKGELLDVLIELGAAEAVLSRSRRFLQDNQRGDKIRPLPLLSAGWLQDCWRDEPEFRLAAVLAGAGLRERLVAVRPDPSDPQGRRVWLTQEDNRTVWTARSLEDNLLAWVQRQLIEEQRDDRPPSDRPARVKASLDDVRVWLNRTVDEARLEAIARGLCLVALPEQTWSTKLPWLPAEFAAIALVHHRQLPLADNRVLPYVPRLVASLAAGRGDTAIALALQRLRASGLKPAIEVERLPDFDRNARRMGAALAFPLSVAHQGKLLKQIQRHEQGR